MFRVYANYFAFAIAIVLILFWVSSDSTPDWLLRSFALLGALVLYLLAFCAVWLRSGFEKCQKPEPVFEFERNLREQERLHRHYVQVVRGLEQASNLTPRHSPMIDGEFVSR